MSDLRIVAPWTQSNGYCNMSRAVLTAALAAGYRVEARESDYKIKQDFLRSGLVNTRRIYERMRGEAHEAQREEITKAKRTRVPITAPTLFVQIPDSLEGWNEYSSGPRIGWTMCESDRLNPRWARSMHGVDLLLAPSQYCLDTFRRDVPGVSSELCPIPVDPRLYQPVDSEVGVSRRNLPAFIFFSVFSTIPRKGWTVLMQAFAEEFAEDEDVGLLVKPSMVHPVRQLSGWLNKIGKPHPKFFVEVLDSKLSTDEMAAHYRMADCYALPSAEGFGLPFVEAALCGTPSIALDAGGSADVVDEETGYPMPSIFAPCYGQLPHVYDSSHRFPTPDFDEMRKALRRAYISETSGNRKGEVARQRAIERFSPQAVAPRLRELVESSHALHSEKTRIWSLPSLPQYALCIGDGFGDGMATYGNALSVMGGRHFNFIHYGFNQKVGDWLAMQDGVRTVLEIVPADREIFQDIANRAGGHYGLPTSAWLPELLEDTGIDPSTVAPTQVHWPWAAWEPNRPANMHLGAEAYEWAEQKRAELGEFILVQPYSTSSVGLQEHWPHWSAFLRWLLDRCASSHLLVFCGLNKIPGLEAYPGAVDLIGQTPSMLHVLALCERAKGVISTCNAVANWTAIRNLPGLIAANAAIERPLCFWRKFLGTPNNTVLGYEATMDEMIAAAEVWLGEVGK